MFYQAKATTLALVQLQTYLKLAMQQRQLQNVLPMLRMNQPT